MPWCSPEQLLLSHGMHPTNVVLGCTVRQVGFAVVLPKHKLEQQGVFMPLMLLQAACLLLTLKGQLNLTFELTKSKLACKASCREAATAH